MRLTFEFERGRLCSGAFEVGSLSKHVCLCSTCLRSTSCESQRKNRERIFELAAENTNSKNCTVRSPPKSYPSRSSSSQSIAPPSS